MCLSYKCYFIETLLNTLLTLINLIWRILMKIYIFSKHVFQKFYLFQYDLRLIQMRNLSMSIISCCTRLYVFTSFAPLKRNFSYVELFSEKQKNSKKSLLKQTDLELLDLLPEFWCNQFQKGKHKKKI